MINLNSVTPPPTYVSWDSVGTSSQLLADKIFNSGVRPDIIVAILRGGAIIGVLLSHSLKIPNLLTIPIRTTSRDGPNPPRIPPEVGVTGNLSALRGKTVLIVDDAVTTGKTFATARQLLHSASPGRILTAAAFWDKQASSACPADFHGDVTPGWVMFPWEIGAHDQLN